jgi:hypothetical protein
MRGVLAFCCMLLMALGLGDVKNITPLGPLVLNPKISAPASPATDLKRTTIDWEGTWLYNSGLDIGQTVIFREKYHGIEGNPLVEKLVNSDRLGQFVWTASLATFALDRIIKWTVKDQATRDGLFACLAVAELWVTNHNRREFQGLLYVPLILPKFHGPGLSAVPGGLTLTFNL